LGSNAHPYEKYREQVRVVLQSKLEEFRLLDYGELSEAQLWEYLLKKKWRKPKEDIHIHEIVRDIFAVKVSDVFHYQTMEQMQSADWFSEEGAEELKKLLK